MMVRMMMQRRWRCAAGGAATTTPLLLLLLWLAAVISASPVSLGNKNDLLNNKDDASSSNNIDVEAEATLLLQQQQQQNMDKSGHQHHYRELKVGDNMLYSNMATIVPDPEHLPIDKTMHDAVAATWDAWHFWDGQEDERPTGDYCGEYDPIYRDIAGDALPDESWQVDAVFVNHLLNDGEKLVSRAMEAIFTEYGHGKPLPPEALGQRLRMFHWEKIVDLSSQVKAPPGYERTGKRSTGGWTTKRSWNGLVRRLLHACMTNDEFVVVLGGHSAAAGHGGHFHQSYMHQFHRIVSPILARLGVKLITRNMSQGGLGTLQASMGMQDLYGNGIDLLLWDSGMTESSASHRDFFLRQALLGGKTKIPMVLGGASIDFDVLKYLHEHADIDVGQYGMGLEGIIPVTSAQQAETEVPYASRYMECQPDVKYLCAEAPRFCAKCWIDRDDIPQSKVQELFPELQKTPGSQVKWHPGWREHQLQGRVLAFAVLDALQIALQVWSAGTMGGPPLDDDEWHVTEYYKNMRNKLQALGQREEVEETARGACWEMQKQGLPGRICTTALHGATQHTPRVNPTETSLTRLIRPASNGYKPENLLHMQYEGPDVHNPCFDPEEGAIDVVAIVSGRRRRRQLQQSSWKTEEDEEDFMPRLFRQLHESRQARVKAHEEQEKRALSAISASRQNRKLRNSSDSPRYLALDDEKIEPGIGWQVTGELPGLCDGSYYAICGREQSNQCPVLGHHDGRGQVVGNEYSGWLIFDVPAVEKGLIIMKMFTWNSQESNRVTDGWTSVNNQDGSQTRRERQLSRNETTATTTTIKSQGNHTNDEDNEWTALPFLDLKEQDDEASSYMDNMMDHSYFVGQQDETRFLKGGGPPLQPAHKTLPDDTFAFDFAIDGKITTWNKQEFLDHKRDVQRVVEVFVLLDDPNFIPKNGPSVEVAIRMRGCGRLCTFGITHLYWA